MSSPSSISTIIRAGAGAGKTTRLIEEVYTYFISYKKNNKVWPKIVLTTFSNKATQEINERLLKKAIQTYNADFFDFINSSSHLLVSTIHGVLHLFISQDQSEFGLTKDFNIVSDSEMDRRHQKLFRKIVQKAPQAVVLLEVFTLSELYEMVKNYQHFRLTEGLIKPLSEHTFRSYIVKLRSEIKMELQNAIETLKSAKLSDSWENCVQSFPTMDGMDENFIQSLIRWEASLMRLPTVSKKGTNQVVDAQMSFILGIKKLRDFRDKNYHESFIDNFQAIQNSFQELAEIFFNSILIDQRVTQEISISDIETLCYQALPTKPYLFQEFSLKWDFWMIDEFQDTSPIQVALLSKLIGRSRSFFVGDPQQSIYSFRGSDSKVFENKYSELAATGHVEVLDNNYRSHSGVLGFINEFFSTQYRQFKKMNSIKESLDLPHDVGVYEVSDKKLVSKITAKQIAELIESEPTTKLEDIVILSRTNKDLSDLATQLEAINIPHYVHSQGRFFKQREVLDILFFVRFLLDPQDTTNLVFLLKTPAVGLNNEQARNIVKKFSNWRKLAEESAKENNQMSIAVQLLEAYKNKCTQVGLIETTQLFAISAGSFVLAHSMDSSGKKESNLWKLFYWLRSELDRGMDSFLMQIENVLNPVKNDNLEESEGQAIIEPEKIQMMTIHASKGLQFSHVIVIGTNNSPRTRGRFTLDFDPVSKEYSVFLKNSAKDDKIRSPIHWQQWAMQKERENDEFERLLYVALTRAKNKVSVFTLGKFSEASWSSRFFNFYNQLQVLPQEVPFKMSWQKIETSDPKVLSSKEVYEVVGSLLQDNGAIEKKDSESMPKTNEFLKKMDFLLQNAVMPNSISFSSTKEAGEANLHQIMVSQRGIEIHQRREKGIVDFSYYPKLELSLPLSQIFAMGFKEYRFTFLFKGSQIVGSIDFVFFRSDRVLIIDYKSGLSQHNELYRQQLIFYAQCLSYIKKLNKDIVFDLVIDYVDQRKVDHSGYRCLPADDYFSTFLLLKKNQNI